MSYILGFDRLVSSTNGAVGPAAAAGDGAAQLGIRGSLRHVPAVQSDPDTGVQLAV